uniref:Site-specific integrase n=1 Tax=Phenylobacterium glaciei TaxID=2803784 RepID=A0A974P5A0_9CAUL|nr:site-specific integrase [Phenylobacterium glaciei]
MIKRNAENERVKRDYLIWMREARGRSEETLDIAAAAIDRFQTHTGYKAFKTFRPEQATSFKADLSRQTSPASGKPLSKATLYGTLKGVQAFFEWLSREPGYRQAVRMSDAEYFTLNRNDARVATATRERPSPSLEQVRHVLSVMPTTTTLERRDRALIAFILLTGMRDAAVISLKLKRLDIGRKQVSQDARDVKTKAAKTFASHFFPVGEDVELIVREWVEELTQTHLFGPDDPVFPPPGSVWTPWANSRPPASAGITGLSPIRCGRSSGRPSRRRACPTSIRTACAAPSCAWPMTSNCRRAS